jgi:transcriptional regulator of arginine metabolism
MSKVQRHQKILELVRAGGVQNQEQLRAILASQGFAVNQSTLSRDVRDLELVKGARGYQLATPDAPPALPRTARKPQNALAAFLLTAVAAQNLVVLKTAPGHAQPLAVALDRSPLPEVIGSLAGDDTILLVTADATTAKALADRLLQMARAPA